MISEHVRGLGTSGVVEKDDEDCAEERRARKQTQLNRAPIDEGVHDFVHQFREFVIAIWLSPGRQGLALLTIGTILAIFATAAAQVGLNAWNRPFYEAISARNFLGFVHQLLVFAAIAGGLLVLNVAQAWLRKMIKLRSREWLTRDLFAKWLKPSAPSRLAGAGEIGCLKVEIVGGGGGPRLTRIDLDERNAGCAERAFDGAMIGPGRLEHDTV